MSQPQPQLHSTDSRSARDALITAPTAPRLELRQNNPQDCSNLIAASVDRATVEISRTIISLNASFSQQLQQVSISASNGIRSAENSASSSISIVSQNASSATSSASFSLNLANLAVTSVNSALFNANIALASAQSQAAGVNLALTSALSASTSDVLRLSSSLSSMEATLVSVQVTMTSPSEEPVANQNPLQQASASTALALAVMSQQSLSNVQVVTAISLAPIQLAGIVVGTMLASVFLSFTVGCVLFRTRKKEKIDSLNDRAPTKDPKMPFPRYSNPFRTGNSVAIRFSPPTSVHEVAPAPTRERQRNQPATHLVLSKEESPMVTSGDAKAVLDNPFASRDDGWPLTYDTTGANPDFLNIGAIPHDMDTQDDVSATESSSGEELYSRNGQEIVSTVPTASPPGRSSHGEMAGTPRTTSRDPHPTSPLPLSFDSLRRLTAVLEPEAMDASHQVDLNEEYWRIREPAQYVSSRPIEKNSQELLPNAEIHQDPFKDLTVEAYESLVDEVFEDFPQHSTRRSIEASNKTSTDDMYIEEPMNQEGKPVWNEPDETLLEKGMEATPEVENLTAVHDFSYLATVANIENSGVPALFNQSEDTSQLLIVETQDPIHYTLTQPPVHIREHSPGKGTSSRIPFEITHSLPDSRDETIATLSQKPSVGFLGRTVEPQNPATENDEKEISPLRRNPPFEPFGAVISLFEERQGGAPEPREANADQYEPRGRSMIRTSDIIEARLSGLAQANKQHEDILQHKDRQGEPADSLSASSMPSRSFAASDQAHRIQLPRELEPAAEKQRTSIKPPLLASNSLSRPVSATSAAVNSRREEPSPLRRNPPDTNPPPHRPPGAGHAAGNGTREFTQALSKFQTLISQNPQDAIVASNEVTSRAIAGIYIPGSLREQAVRNLSRSRERGTGRGR